MSLQVPPDLRNPATLRPYESQQDLPRLNHSTVLVHWPLNELCCEPDPESNSKPEVAKATTWCPQQVLSRRVAAI